MLDGPRRSRDGSRTATACCPHTDGPSGTSSRVSSSTPRAVSSPRPSSSTSHPAHPEPRGRSASGCVYRPRPSGAGRLGDRGHRFSRLEPRLDAGEHAWPALADHRADETARIEAVVDDRQPERDSTFVWGWARLQPWPGSLLVEVLSSRVVRPARADRIAAYWGTPKTRSFAETPDRLRGGSNAASGARRHAAGRLSARVLPRKSAREQAPHEESLPSHRQNPRAEHAELRRTRLAPSETSVIAATVASYT
jgi:hypothetical protein